MTKIITRYFDSVERARAARKDLVFVKRVSRHIVHLYEDADGLTERLAGFSVDPATADAYRQRLEKGGAVLLVKAGYKPLGVAQTVRDVTAELGAADLGDLVEEVSVKEDNRHAPSVDTDHPLIMSQFRDPDDTNHHMANWPIPLISRRKPFTYSLIEPHARMADKFWPLTIRVKPYSWSIFDDHQRMANWPIGLLVPGQKFMAKFPFGHIVPGHKFMAKFPFGHIIPGHKFQAKFPFGHLVPGQPRMANWPFPLLINGKTGTNALMPGGPRMANFPIPLLSGRKPYDKTAFPRHARMANFPISLISKRKPFTGSIFPRHARMANFILPLVIRTSERTHSGWRREPLVSRMFGIPTLARR